jgi:hypothetical protein
LRVAGRGLADREGGEALAFCVENENVSKLAVVADLKSKGEGFVVVVVVALFELLMLILLLDGLDDEELDDGRVGLFDDDEA